MADAPRNHSLFPLETCPQVPDEAFKQFHTIDRELYACLTHTLRRDSAESVQVMAFLMWLERECRKNLVKAMTSLPPLLVNQLANEAAACVKCIESDTFLFGETEIKTLSELANLPDGVGLRFFHENRIAVLRGVSKIANTVCWRAFGDLFQPATWRADMIAETAPHAMQFRFNPYLDHVLPVLPVVPVPSAVAGGLLGMAPHRPPVAADAIGLPLHVAAAQQQMLGTELGDLMRRNLNLSLENENQEQDVAADDRTIFLTFSKGYPTTEEEVREYFTRKFGDFIEDLIMQEVEGGEQPLYAKMVARSATVIDGIVDGNKAKYSINGKHVWARKYVKKPPQQRSPPRGEGSGSGSGSSPAKIA